METVIAWAFIFFYLKIRRDHRYFTALSFLLSSHTLLSYVNRFEFILQDKDVYSGRSRRNAVSPYLENFVCFEGSYPS